MGKINHYLSKIRWKLMNNDQRIAALRKRGVTIGNQCSISSDVKFGTEPYLISIGNHVRLTSNVQFITHDGSMWVLRGSGIVPEGSNLFGKIGIGNNVNIGWNTVIMPNVTIGDNCIIGIGTVVTKNIPNNSVAAGIPARIICTVDEYYKKHSQEFINLAGVSSKQRKQTIIEWVESKKVHVTGEIDG